MNCSVVYSTPPPAPYYRPGPVRRGSGGASFGIAVAAILLGVAPDVIAVFTGMPDVLGDVLAALPVIPVLIYCAVVAPTPGRRTAAILLLILSAVLDIGAILLVPYLPVAYAHDWDGLAANMAVFLPAQLVLIVAWGTARRVGAGWWFSLLAGIACAAAWRLGVVGFNLLGPLWSVLPSDDVGSAVFTVIIDLIYYPLLFVVPIAFGAMLDQGAAARARFMAGYGPGAYPPPGYAGQGYVGPGYIGPGYAGPGPGAGYPAAGHPGTMGPGPGLQQPGLHPGMQAPGMQQPRMQQSGTQAPGHPLTGRPPNTAAGPNSSAGSNTDAPGPNDPFGRR